MTTNNKPKEVGIVKCLNPVQGLGKYIPIGSLLMFEDDANDTQSKLIIQFDKDIDLSVIPTNDYGKKQLVIHWRSFHSNETVTALIKKEFESE
jgi:hypothetical protein